MTATAVGPRVSHRFHDRAVFWPTVVATVAIAGAAALLPAPPTWLAALVVVVTVVGLGLPHGAVDHLVAEAITGRSGRAVRRRFIRNYLSAMAVVVVTWLLAPFLALSLFLLVSIHHFGQSDLGALSSPTGASRRVLQWSRGLLLVGLPSLAHPTLVAPVVERLGGGDPASWSWLAERPGFWVLLLIGQHVAVLASVARRIVGHGVLLKEAVTVVVLSMLLVATHPLVGFAIYFGAWHSVAHLLVLADVVGSPRGSLRSVFRLGAPLTAVSAGAVVVFGGAVAAAGRFDLVVPVAFVLVSVVTLPHAVVVERLWSGASLESPAARDRATVLRRRTCARPAPR